MTISMRNIFLSSRNIQEVDAAIWKIRPNGKEQTLLVRHDFPTCDGPLKRTVFSPRSRKRNRRMLNLAQVDVTEPNRFG